MEGMTMATNQQHFEACQKWQKFFDDHLRDVGATAPPFIPGQTSDDYIRESCRTFKRTFLPQNHDLYRVQWRDRDGLRSDALHVLVPQLMDACKREAENPNTVTPGEFRKITRRNPYGQVTEHVFIGPESFVKRMGRPGRLARIRNPTTDPGWFPRETPSVWLTGRKTAA
jgi:hypothetical protein